MLDEMKKRRKSSFFFDGICAWQVRFSCGWGHKMIFLLVVALVVFLDFLILKREAGVWIKSAIMMVGG